MWGVYGALGYDVHLEILGPSLIPWIIYFTDAAKAILLIVIAIVAVLAKEATTIQAILLFFMLSLYYKSDKHRRRLAHYGLLIALLSTLLLIAYNTYAEKNLNALSRGTQMYSHIWSNDPLNPSEYPISLPSFIKNILRNAYFFWALLWESPVMDQAAFGVKSELHLSALISSGWVIFSMPILLIGALPLYFYKLYAIDYMI